MNRDYFAEMYVAGVLADAGWNVYFPRRDQGFDFIITKLVGERIVLRPVQVKGKYPRTGKVDRAIYGYSGRLTQTHPEMVLAIPLFATAVEAAPMFTAYLPPTQLRRLNNTSDGYRVFPARFADGGPEVRPSYSKFFDRDGIRLMESAEWAILPPLPPDNPEETEMGDAASLSDSV